LESYGADTGGQAQWDRGQCLAGLRAGVLGRTRLEAWTPEAHEVAGHRAVAPMPVGLPMAVVLDHVLPGGQKLRRTPVTIRECGPGPPHSCRTETESSESGDDRAAALEQAPTEQRPQEMEKT
jgi:hypothetical protein